mmetsp:Transcript_28744/g.52112  ORF Transcript_28744/g.52112 Transcript_28744/m.52112 type:complete len:1231 (+) Transcript_28744:107-3799(+)|eukprot:CAMPEP_0197623786 /NCGR_PEP_ID=MMETSP1338-20131121/3713_1 /TAXON_ID=43686 ORGANISM="Pelagodinium beii, Strain RCC1491" /NCGR_SAMPLE_ID=MMETSP1338 /ASSEMBLY_ACC=CAM_ASM_000754 /LENGTH=1230 /DNA_ID=CAMNT_0043193861 /DNA_START=107 /DNA_END=3799 /DNA_ORIENTATION=-
MELDNASNDSNITSTQTATETRTSTTTFTQTSTLTDTGDLLQGIGWNDSTYAEFFDHFNICIIATLVLTCLYVIATTTRKSWASPFFMTQVGFIADYFAGNMHWQGFFALMQALLCVLFTARAEQFQLPEIFSIIELVACTAYTLNLILPMIIFAGTMGKTTARAFQEDILPWSFAVVSVSYRSFTGQLSHFSFGFVAALKLASTWRSWVQLTSYSRLAPADHYGMYAVDMLCYLYITSSIVREVETLGGQEPNLFLGSEPSAGIDAATKDRWSLAASTYYIAICALKAGYGDLLPASPVAKAVSYLGTGYCAYLLGALVLKLLEGYDVSGVAKSEYVSRPGVKHVVIAGTPSVQVLRDFLVELFHEDHKADNETLMAVFLFLPGQRTVINQLAVLMESDPEMKSTKGRVWMVEGSALKNADLDRVRYKTASCAFLLPNIYSQNEEKEDIGNIMRGLAMKRHTSFVRLVTVVNEEKSLDLLAAAGIPRNDVICCDDITTCILGKASEVQGFACLAGSLMKTSNKWNISDIVGRPDDPWLEDYMQSLVCRVFEVNMPSSYYTIPFSQVAYDVVERSGHKAYLIGLTEEPLFPSDKTNYVLFPNKFYRIGTQNDRIIKGIFMAKDLKDIKMAPPGRPIKWSSTSFVEESVVRVEANNPRLASSKAGRAKEGWVRDHFVEEKDKQEYAKFKLAIAAKRRAALGLVNRVKMSRVHVAEALGDDNALIFKIGEDLEALTEDTSSDLMQDPLERTLLLRQLKAKKEAEAEKKTLEAEAANDWDLGDMEGLRIAMAQIHRLEENEEKFRLPDAVAIEEDNALWGGASAPVEEPWCTTKAPPDELILRGEHTILIHLENSLPPAETAVEDMSTSKVAKRKPLRPGRNLPLKTFVRSMRTQRRKSALVVVSLRVPLDWESVQSEPNVFLVQGPPLDVNTLLRAGLYQAKSIVIYGRDVAKCDHKASADSEASFALRLLEALLLKEEKQHIPIITHLNIEENSILLPETCELPKQKGLMELLAEQNNEEEEVDEATNDVIEAEPMVKLLLQNRYASGLLFVSDAIPRLAANSMYSNCLGSVISEMGKAAFFVLPVTSAWKGLVFGELFEFMMRKRNIMPMGLLRRTDSQDTIDFLDSSLESRRLSNPEETPEQLYRKVAQLAEAMRQLLPEDQQARYIPGESAFKRYTVVMPLGTALVLFNDGVICMMPTTRTTDRSKETEETPMEFHDGPPNVEVVPMK